MGKISKGKATFFAQLGLDQIKLAARLTHSLTTPNTKIPGKLGHGIRAASPARLEDIAENKGVSRQHQQRVTEGPEDALGQPATTPEHLTLDQLSDQSPVAATRADECQGRGGKSFHKAYPSA